MIALPALMTVMASVNSGGFFAGTPASLASVVALVLAGRTLFVLDPLAGIGRRGLIAVASMSLYAVWTILSSVWSHSDATALIEFDRVLLYLELLLLFASLPLGAQRLRWLIRTLAAAFALVSLIGLVSRLLPDVLPTAAGPESGRLGYPITYANGLGLAATLAIVLCLGLAADDGEPRAVRALAGGALPALGACLLLTFSRGAIAVMALGLLMFVGLVRSRSLLVALLASVPPTIVAMLAAYQSKLLATPRFAGGAGTAQGHHVALVVEGCMLAAGALLLVLNARSARVRLRTPSRRAALMTVAAVSLVILITALSLGLPHTLSAQYRRFVNGNVLATTNTPGARLTDSGNNGRIYFWRTALAAFTADPLRGQGAGSYAAYWARHRPLSISAVDGHSLYLETLAELGLVGCLLLTLTLVTILVTLARRLRRSRLVPYASLLVAMAVWVLHAGIDWDWEMPAVTLWFFAAGGAVLARPVGDLSAAVPPAAVGPGQRGRIRSGPGRILVALGCTLLALPPALMAVSQSDLNSAVAQFKHHNCAGATRGAERSISDLSIRPEPFELLAYCQAATGRSRLSVELMTQAAKRDPKNWELHYGLAVVRAAAGLDPRGAALEALKLNPLSPLARNAVRRFRGTNAATWRRLARSAPTTVQ